MSSYTTNLKTWGATGSEFPDGYSYLEGEQPIDDWDNFLTHNIIKDLSHLIDLTNDRLETDSGSSHPSNPEPGHFSHRTDGVVKSGEEVFFYDNTNGEWHRLAQADGEKLTGSLDTGGYQIEDSSGKVAVANPLEVESGRLDHDWYSKQEGGTVAATSAVPIGTFNLADGESLKVTQAMLTEDGFTTPVADGVSLMVIAENGSNETILSGDGTTLYADSTGTPLAEYQNTTGAAEVVSIMIDNGQYGTGAGDKKSAFGGYIARRV